jgi:hypothetical protein
MGEGKYDNLIVTEIKNHIELPSFRHDNGPGLKPRHPSQGGSRRVLWVDGDVVPGGFYSEYVWHYPGQRSTAEQAGPDPHVHSFDEVIAFVGTNQNDHGDLGGEVEIALEGETFTLDRSFLVFVPAGMRHCPLRIKRVDRPIFQYILGSASYYEGTPRAEAKPVSREELARHFVFDYKKNLVHPEYRGEAHEEPGVHLHILYLDSEVVSGANFYVEAAWFGTKPRPKPEPGKEPQGPLPHVHPFPELITFFGTNPDDVHDLGGEVELWIDGERHVMNKSFAAFVPGDMLHCPIMIRNVTRPIFHFTAGPGAKYV